MSRKAITSPADRTARRLARIMNEREYIGDPCVRHPNEAGRRQVNGACIGCVRDRARDSMARLRAERAATGVVDEAEDPAEAMALVRA